MHFDFKAYDFADTGSARDAIAVVDARGVLRWDALQAAVQAWEQAALNAGAVAGVPIVISGHKETSFWSPCWAACGCACPSCPST